MVDKLPPGYRPSPRPDYAVPTLVRRVDVQRHIWGDRESGLVADWIYASTARLHGLLFGLAPGKWFRHSPAFRTVFGADEVLYVLSGAMLIANPANGEVQHCQVGEAVFFRQGTWHHVCAQGTEPLRVLEFFAPPPSQGTSGPYAAQQPYLEKSSYRRDELLGDLSRAGVAATLRHIARRDHSLRVEGEITVGLLASTEHLTVAELAIPAGACGERSAHGGDAMIFGLEGELMIRSWWQGASTTFEIGPHDAVFIPQRGEYEVLSFARAARALLGVAPNYLP